ncbi:hypothetical protein NXW27_27055 [Phocaeicola dorei]|nr:hypothetical protein [Phocaeicola dorei]
MPSVTLDFIPERSEETLKEILTYLNQSGVECYIAIDEFQQIMEYPEKGSGRPVEIVWEQLLMAVFKQLMSMHASNVLMVNRIYDLSVYKYGNGEYLLYLCKRKLKSFAMQRH